MSCKYVRTFNNLLSVLGAIRTRCAFQAATKLGDKVALVSLKLTQSEVLECISHKINP